LGFCGHMHYESIRTSEGPYAVTDSGAVYGYSGYLDNTPLYVKRSGVWRSYFNKTKTLADSPNDKLSETELDRALEKARQEKEQCEKGA
jgi:hypothetical protein